jgi:hypothetical protein
MGWHGGPQVAIKLIRLGRLCPPYMVQADDTKTKAIIVMRNRE